MFINFFYELKRAGVPVSLTEWMTLMDALSKGLAYSSLSEFYHVARAVLVKSETYFDHYDQAFHNYFKGIETPADLIERALQWLNDETPPLMVSPEERKIFQDWDISKLHGELVRQLRKQGGEFHGGDFKKIGTGGKSRFGHGGFNPKSGVRIGGMAGNSSAVKVAAERHYQGYRSDLILGVRKFEAALRILRQLTNRHEGLKDELDINGTIDATCRNGGSLKVIWDRPRKNKLKVVLMMDSGGSMDPHVKLCSQLFSAFKRSSHLKDLKFYYFHNCVYDQVYVNPACINSNAINTYEFMQKVDPEYRLIVVGDASMSPSELTTVGGAIDWDKTNNESGLVWLGRLVKHFPYAVWLNPMPIQLWDERMHYGAHTISLVRQVFPMYELTLSGLEQAVKRLKVRNN